MTNIYWADLHNHNEIGYAKGTLERTYALARNTLDVCAFSAHGYWPDPPDTDPQMIDYHTQAFDRIKAQFPTAIAEANARYVPGQFVTFIAYEWHSIGWGDFVILFPGGKGELYRGQDYDDLCGYVRQQGALLIPHHTAYRHGWRGTNWELVDPALSPIVEVFSEHASSFHREDIWPMILHSMGGATASQTMAHQLRQGRHFGFTAGTDNHFGYPATYGEGITAVLAEALTRESVFEALRNRHCYAATGDRIAMSVTAGEAMMGDVLPADAPRELAIAIDPLAPLDYVELIKNGERAQLWSGCQSPPTADDGRYLVRVEWGWGRMDNPELTQWQIELALQGGILRRVVPCFAGGAGSTELLNLIEEQRDDYLAIRSFTSRDNPMPISGVVLEIEGGPDTLLGGQVTAAVDDERGEDAFRVPLSGLYADDHWLKPLTRFSSPRLRVGQAQSPDSMAMRLNWRDESPTDRDTYVVKAQQRNGQIAWASPILFTD